MERILAPGTWIVNSATARAFPKSFDEPLLCHPERSEGSRYGNKEILHSSALAAQMQVSFRMTRVHFTADYGKALPQGLSQSQVPYIVGVVISAGQIVSLPEKSNAQSREACYGPGK